MKTVTFYHSTICPRCHIAGRSLAQLRDEFPDVVLEEVEYLANLRRARAEGVRTIPALVSGERALSGFYLTKRSIRRFLAELQGA